MKKASIIAVGSLFLILSVPVFSADEFIEPIPKPKSIKTPSVGSEYNFITDKTKTLAVMQFNNRPAALFFTFISYEFEGKTIKRPDFITVELRETDRGISWPTVQRIYFRYGDKKLDLPATYKVTTLGTSFEEVLTVAVPVETFEEMCQSDQVFFKPDGRNYVITKPFMEVWREFSKTIPEKKESASDDKNKLITVVLPQSECPLWVK